MTGEKTKKRRPTVNIEQTNKDKNINIENPETFLIDMPERRNNDKRGNKKHGTTVYAEQEDEAKENNGVKSELEKDIRKLSSQYQKSRRRKKKRST